MSDWFKVAPDLRYQIDYGEDHPAITAALCKVDRHPTLLGDVFAEAVARVFVQGGRTDLCRAHLDMLRWFRPARERTEAAA